MFKSGALGNLIQGLGGCPSCDERVQAGIEPAAEHLVASQTASQISELDAGYGGWKSGTVIPNAVRNLPSSTQPFLDIPNGWNFERYSNWYKRVMARVGVTSELAAEGRNLLQGAPLAYTNLIQGTIKHLLGAE